MHAGHDGTYTEPQRGPQPSFVWLHKVCLIIMGIAVALTLCAGFGWFWLMHSALALRKQEELLQSTRTRIANRKSQLPVMRQSR
jgi:hypothetical protein